MRRVPTAPAPLLCGAIVAASLVAAPLISLVAIAWSGDIAALGHVVLNVLPTALVETTLLLAGVAAITGLIGVGTAWLTTMTRFPGRGILAVALVLPLAMPTYIVAYVAVELLEPLGPIQAAFRALFGFRSRAEYPFPEVRSLPGAILVISLVLYPYVYLPTRALFLTGSAGLFDAARTLGAAPGRLFARVGLPLARPALAIGLALALLEALNDIGASEYLGVRTLTVAIMTTWLNRGSLAGAAQIALVMLLVVVLLLQLEARGRGGARYAAPSRQRARARPVPLDGARACVAFAACSLPVLAGFVVPAGFLMREAVARTLRDGIDPALPGQASATLVVAIATTSVAVGLGASVAGTVRLARGARPVLALALARLAGLGYAIPGTVLAIGLLSPLAGLDNALATASSRLFGVSPGLLVTGSGAAIVIACTIRFLTVAVGGVRAGYERLARDVDDAARVLGRAPGEVVREVHLPLLRPALRAAALLVFVDAMKELPATLLLRPLGVETLATAVYAHATRGTFEDGALAALAIVAAGLLPVAAMSRELEPPGMSSGGRLFKRREAQAAGLGAYPST